MNQFEYSQQKKVTSLPFSPPPYQKPRAATGRSVYRRLGPALASLLLFIGLLQAWVARADSQAPGATGTIAFVNATTGDEIRLVEPDGSNNRRLWAHGQDDPLKVYNVWSLDWRPDAAEIAFASNHENYCSINDGDIFVVGMDGSAYRRLTQGPSCAGLGAYPKGSVKVPVRNSSIFGDTFSGFVYFQGAPSILPVNLPPGGTTTLTFNDVADFGDGELQLATMIVPPYRAVSIASAVDVKTGQTVMTSQMDIYVPDTFWENRSPTWRSDGSAVGFFLNFASMKKLPPHPGPLELGDELQTDQSAMPDFTDMLHWGPPSKANQLLYRGSVAFDSQGIYLTTEGSANAGQKLLSYEVYEYVRGIDWLPDGSGFVYSVEELDGGFEALRANIFEYNFASKQSKRLTNFSNQFTGLLSVSPDGQQIVFDRADSNDSDAPADLFIINRDGSGLRLLANNGRAPDWSPKAVATPQRLFLPSVLANP